MAPKREYPSPPPRASGDPFDGDYSDKWRAKAVKSDDARKRAARWYSNHGEEIPPAYFRREVVEFDRLRAEQEGRRRQARIASEGSSSGAASSFSTVLLALSPVEDYEANAFGSSVVVEDFVDDEAFEAATAQVLLWSVREAEEWKAQLDRDEELDQILLHQGLGAYRRARERRAYWEEDAVAIIDLVSDED